MRITFKSRDKYHFRDGIGALAPGGMYTLEFETEAEARKAEKAARQWIYYRKLQYMIYVERKGTMVRCRKTADKI